MNTVVGIYKTVAEATKAQASLKHQGFDSDDLKLIDQSDEQDSEGSVGQKIKHFFSAFSDHDEEANSTYINHVTAGGALLAVRVEDKDAAKVADMLYAEGATDIQADDSYKASSSAGSATTSANAGYAQDKTNYADQAIGSGERAIPIVQEDLVVGKREVNRGGVRVFSHVVSEPVSANVTLHDERIVVDRHMVNRQATDADFGDNRVIELTATGEEAVVGKTSRVVEEVLVGKQGSDRTEQINDSVRHTEVEVEEFTGTEDTKMNRY